jgi:three-Cys-motif partner protein
MAVPKTTIWDADPHTKAKHAILRRYLNAWLPIMATWNGRIVFIDGFAGPGRYADGSPGSPIIAIKCLLDHPQFKTRPPKSGVTMLFIEKEKDRAENLEREIEDLRAKQPFPEWLSIDVVCSTFEGAMDKLLGYIESKQGQLAPAFAFIDPFGFSDAPLSVIARIAKNAKCECLITFMFESVNRFLKHPDPAIQAHFDELFGTAAWREILTLSDRRERRDRIVELYRNQLRAAGFSYVRTFEMLDDGNRTEYFLYFGTNSLTGLSKMKQSMWSVDPLGGSLFSDYTNTAQTILLQPTPDTLPLRHELQARFRGAGWVTIEEIQRFVLEHSAFSEEKHVKRGTLAPMEAADPPLIEVERPVDKKKKKGTYPPGTKVRFI